MRKPKPAENSLGYQKSTHVSFHHTPAAATTAVSTALGLLLEVGFLTLEDFLDFFVLSSDWEILGDLDLVLDLGISSRRRWEPELDEVTLETCFLSVLFTRDFLRSSLSLLAASKWILC